MRLIFIQHKQPYSFGCWSSTCSLRLSLHAFGLRAGSLTMACSRRELTGDAVTCLNIFSMRTRARDSGDGMISNVSSLAVRAISSYAPAVQAFLRGHSGRMRGIGVRAAKICRVSSNRPSPALTQSLGPSALLPTIVTAVFGPVWSSHTLKILRNKMTGRN